MGKGAIRSPGTIKELSHPATHTFHTKTHGGTLLVSRCFAPKLGEELYLNLTISQILINVVLLREEKGIKKPNLFTSRALLNSKTRYSTEEKLVLLWRHYIIIMISYLLKANLSKSDIVEMNSKAAMSLSSFDIQYKPTTSKKRESPHRFPPQM